MIYVETNSIIGSENLAFEEYFLKKEDIREPVLMLWRNRPTIVVGAFQNTHEEICEEFVKANKIDVVRRTSGGGAVYHDLGNLCFSFIMEHGDFTNTDYSAFLKPVVEALRGMGIQAGINGRNDLVLGDAKISGSAVRIYKNRVLFHGTLLFSSDLEILSRALRVKQDKLVSKGIKSVRSRVTTIAEHLSYDMDVLEFRERLLQALFGESGGKEYEISRNERREIMCLARDKYESFLWTYGKNPPADLTHGKRFGGGSITVKASLKNSRIEQIRFEGDFLGCMEMKDIEGTAYTLIAYSKALRCKVRLVIWQMPNGKKKLFFSTDPSLSGEEVLLYYRTRFQIEFCFRDAKGYTGLTDCQARDKWKLDFAFNASFTSLNVAKVTMKEMGMEYSMSSFKSLMTNIYLVKRIFKASGYTPNRTLISKIFKDLSCLQRIAA